MIPTGKTIVLVDSGMIKYAAKFVAFKRYGFKSMDPTAIVQLNNRPDINVTLYDVLSIMIRQIMKRLREIFGNLDEIVFCIDRGVSWRAQIPRTPIPGAEVRVSGGEYKGSRRTDDEEIKHANVVYNRTYDNAMLKISELSNISIVYEPSYEADDFMISLGQTLSANGNHVVILTDDYDITQAVQTLDNGGFCYIFQWKHGNCNMVVDHAAVNSIQNFDIFHMSNVSIPLANAIKSAQIIAPQYLVMQKIVNGDVSDDITPIIVREVGKRKYRCNQKGFDRIHEHFSQKNSEGYFCYRNLYNDDDILDILDIVHDNVHKLPFSMLNSDWQNFYIEKFKENRKMVAVNEQEIGNDRWNRCIQLYEALPHLQPITELPSYDILRRQGITV